MINQIYYILVEFQNQDKQILLCKVLTHIGIKGKEEIDKVAKQTIYMSGMTTTKLSFTDNYLAIR